MGFWVLWILLSIWKTRFRPALQAFWGSHPDLLRMPALRLVALQQFLSDKLRINKLYISVWKLLIAFALLVMIVSLGPEQLQMLAVLNLGLSTFPLAFLLILTFEYIFIPQELMAVRIEAPSYVSRPVARASIILCLLFLAWWVFHALFMLNLNGFLTIYHTTGFHFLDGSTATPQIWDFLFYSFALMTNANYSELQPGDFLAKFYTMFVIATGLTLFVVFLSVALSSPSETVPKQSDSAKEIALRD
jgi:hypothetical protein